MLFEMSSFDIEHFQDLLLQLRTSDSKFVKKDTVVAILQWLISNGERIAELLNDTFVDLDDSVAPDEEDSDAEAEDTSVDESMPDVVTSGAAALLRAESKSSQLSQSGDLPLSTPTVAQEAPSGPSFSSARRVRGTQSTIQPQPHFPHHLPGARSGESLLSYLHRSAGR